jgi:hypothetical protein
MTIGIKYIAYANSSGYGLSALGYVRALHNIGVPVWWQPSFLGGPADRIWRPDQGFAALPLARAAAGDASLSDLPALAQGLCRPIEYDTVIMHTVPEHWPRIAERGMQNIGYTTWETDGLPDHWPPLLALPDKLFVPSTSNGELFPRGTSGKPVHVVPHIRRHAWNTPTPDEKISLRRKLGIPGDHFVFYTIGVWDPRKALGDLVALFARQFTSRDKVTLLIKTSAAPSSFAAGAQPGAPIPALVRAEVDAAYVETGVSAAPIALLAAEDVSGRTIDVLHAIGDCFVSVTRGEGWGLGAFDAATLGKPVIIRPHLTLHRIGKAPQAPVVRPATNRRKRGSSVSRGGSTRTRPISSGSTSCSNPAASMPTWTRCSCRRCRSVYWSMSSFWARSRRRRALLAFCGLHCATR